jgi:6-phosphogluconolactonase
MPTYMYVSASGDDKILIFTLDPKTGKLKTHGEVAVTGSPSNLVVDPSGQYMYVARKGTKEISSFRRNKENGDLSFIGTIPVEAEPGFLATDRKGKYLFVTYFWVGKVAVYPIDNKGVAGVPPVEMIDTAKGVHSVETDPSNKFVFYPHIAVIGPNLILQFKFNETTGHLTPNTPDRVIPEEGVGPRDYCFHPKMNTVYFCNEEGSSVSAFRLDTTAGTLSALQSISTIPDSFKEKNRCALIHITPSGKSLYVANRGHNSIACFSVDERNGLLTTIGQVPTEPETRAFSLDLAGDFLFAAGEKSGRLLSYRINRQTGELTPLDVYSVGKAPWWILPTK